MKIVDANVLLAAVNASDHRSDVCRAWLDEALNGTESVGFPVNSLLAFLRLSTHASVMPNPLAVGQAMEQIEHWLSAPAAVIPEPDVGHIQRTGALLIAVKGSGALTSDAHIAALAIENEAEVVSLDGDFERFPGVTRVDPGAA